MNEPWLKRSEVAAELQVSARTVARYIRPTAIVGGQNRYLMSDVRRQRGRSLVQDAWESVRHQRFTSLSCGQWEVLGGGPITAFKRNGRWVAKFTLDGTQYWVPGGPWDRKSHAVEAERRHREEHEASTPDTHVPVLVWRPSREPWRASLLLDDFCALVGADAPLPVGYRGFLQPIEVALP